MKNGLSSLLVSSWIAPLAWHPAIASGGRARRCGAIYAAPPVMSRLPDGQAGQLQMILRAMPRGRLPGTHINRRNLKALAGCVLTTLFFLIFLAF
jgi:hypothetical protein